MLKDDVLNRFNKYKNDYKLLNILYGIKAIEKMSFVFYPRDKISQNKWIKSMKNKKDNCVYFVYNHKKKGKSHRFLAKNSDLGEPFNKSKTIKKRKSVKSRKMKGGYPLWFDNIPKEMSLKKFLRLKKSKPKNKSMKVWIKENKKYTKKKKTQKGGICPCALAPASALFGAGIAGGASFFNSFSSNNSSYKTIMNGPKGKKQESSEKSIYKENRNGKKSQKKISRRNNLIKIGNNGTRIKTDSINFAKMLYNKLKPKYLN